MPELPEVEVVRHGIQSHVLGRSVAAVEVFEPRSIRRHLAGAADFAAQVQGVTIAAVERRGKFMWLRAAAPAAASGRLEAANRPSAGAADLAVVVHLGMSGQVLLDTGRTAAQRHTRVILRFARPAVTLRFDDQRMFGGLHADELVTAPDGRLVPASVAHIAPDPFEDTYELDAVVSNFRRRRAPLKSLLLNQELVSGIGNIYADEALWRARLHWRTPGDELSARKARDVLQRAHEVMAEALAQGGTSFDALYVNVNGQSGYFSRSLNAYGQEGEPCARCGARIVREPFANRSSYRCPRCQRR
ncbi:MAG: bifunctional DNA-formamidopyrimidine glycosylase/DNA-(apurinic or apyrimidinic site) lyase [Actinomycetales bacterium]|nr:bifunctional DNA-formamidopyrimidine glycosylase/DNA-(apurinic or apyrimidinic site) lyase [Actinomycetales bacterium]